MVDTVDTKVLFTGKRKYIVKLTNISDGSGEADVVKVDVSTLTGPDGTPATYTAIEEIQWSIQGFISVRLKFDATTDDEALTLAAGNGFMNFTNVGGVVDPKSAGTTGDILLTTAGAISGATYDITLVIRLKD